MKESAELKSEKKKPAARSKTTVKKPALRRKPEFWELRLYVSGQTPKSIAAFSNLKRICEEHLKGKYRIEVIDLVENPKLAAGDQILAIPTLVRKLPEPVRKIIGDLSNQERVLVELTVVQSHNSLRNSSNCAPGWMRRSRYCMRFAQGR